LQKLRKNDQGRAPEATELISYGIPAFKHHRMLVYYAAFRIIAPCSASAPPS